MTVLRDQELRAHTEDTVRRHIGTALEQRGLLCGAAVLEESDAYVAAHARDLPKRALPLWYPELDGPVGVAVNFGDAHTSARAGGALAFGAVAATLMAPAHAAVAGPATMACGLFNLGVGLVDGLCDSEPPAGTLLLDIVESGDLQGATERPRARGWLLAALPRRLATHPSLSFTLRVMEAFLELVHLVFPDRADRPGAVADRSPARRGAGRRATVAELGEPALSPCCGGELSSNVGLAVPGHRTGRDR